MSKMPLIRLVEWVQKNRVRLFFSSGMVLEVDLPWVKDAKRAKIVDHGMGLDPGNGFDVSASRLIRLGGHILQKGRRGFASVV